MSPTESDEWINDLPPFDDYSMTNRTYRYFKGDPLYPFGFGLSYTTFSYSNMKLSTDKLKAGDPLEVSVDVKNTGSLAGDEIAQLYLLPPESGNGGLSPKLQLEGVQRINLKPGESKHLTYTLSPRLLSEVDAEGKRSVQSGEYGLGIGGTQPDQKTPTAQRATFTIEGSYDLPR